MKIYSTLQIGSFHTNHCEDFTLTTELGRGKHLVAVMDGCTMGEESVFASILLGKILKNSSKKYYYQGINEADHHPDLNGYLKEILRELISELKKIKNQLGLETNELLSTLILGIVDENASDAELIVIGDGLICADGQYTEFEQGDKPDYLAYHLSKDFDSWFDRQEQFVSVKNFSDLSITTDGIYTFKNFGNSREQKDEEAFKSFLLKNQEGCQQDHFLDNKLLSIREEWKYAPGDDLAIIRIIRSGINRKNDHSQRIMG